MHTQTPSTFGASCHRPKPGQGRTRGQCEKGRAQSFFTLASCAAFGRWQCKRWVNCPRTYGRWYVVGLRKPAASWWNLAGACLLLLALLALFSPAASVVSDAARNKTHVLVRAGHARCPRMGDFKKSPPQINKPMKVSSSCAIKGIRIRTEGSRMQDMFAQIFCTSCASIVHQQQTQQRTDAATIQSSISERRSLFDSSECKM